MKRFFTVPLAAALLLGACAENDESKGAKEPQGIVFELSAVEKLTDGFGTRAPLYSQEAVQAVEVVNVYVFAQSGVDYLYTKTFPVTWTKGSTFKRFEIPAGQTLAPGSYKFLAVGRDNDQVNPYNFTNPTPTTKFDDFSAWITSLANQELELFAGSQIAVIVGTGARIPIQMTRQVAGVLGYFKNVPADINGSTVKYLRLTVSNANKMVNLTTGFGSDPGNTAYNIINVDLSTQTVNSNGAYSGNDLTAQGVVKLPNTQLNGAYLIPINGVTMTLGLYDAANVPLKTWSVIDGVSPLINVLPNHFYALGIKTKTGNTDGGGGVGSIPDAPIDLMKDQVITITIIPDWTLIHNLGIL